MKKNNKFLLAFLVLLVVIVIIILVLNKNNETINNVSNSSNVSENNSINNINKQNSTIANDINNSKIDINIKDITDYDMYFTILSMLSKYSDNLINGDSSNLIKLLDSNYLKNNNLNASNVLSKLNYFDGELSFDIQEMFYIKVKGIKYVFLNVYDDYSTFSNTYLRQKEELIILKYNSNNFVIEFDEYQDDLKKYINSYSNYVDSIEDNSSNEYEKVETDDFTIYNKYLSNFVNLLLNDQSSAYKHLGNNTKEKYSYEQFLNSSNDIFNYLNQQQYGYNKVDNDDELIYVVEFINDSSFVTIHVKSILDYYLEFD